MRRTLLLYKRARCMYRKIPPPRDNYEQPSERGHAEKIIFCKIEREQIREIAR
jgi:hypothetical protein